MAYDHAPPEINFASVQHRSDNSGPPKFRSAGIVTVIDIDADGYVIKVHAVTPPRAATN